MSKETSSKNEPINERPSQSGTQGSQPSGQNPMPTGTSPQNKCEVCGQTFSNQSELNEHNKKVHNIEPDKMGKEAGSVNKGNETSSTQSGERDIGSQKPMQN